MAQKVLVQLVDDLDGSQSDDIETVTFALDGVTYEIDLSPKNTASLRDLLAAYVGAARRTGGRAKRGTGNASATSATADRAKTRAIREWARQEGHDLADRGRIPAHVVEAFEAAQASVSGPTKRGRKKVASPAFTG